MNVLSLFDGMSCGQIALQRVGIKVDKYYASEIDKYAQQNRVYDTDGISPALMDQMSCGSHKILENKSKIRRLTPLECERLQTVPDNYTNVVSDTQRYKMLGNGWTVDVIAHILKFL